MLVPRREHVDALLSGRLLDRDAQAADLDVLEARAQSPRALVLAVHDDLAGKPAVARGVEGGALLDRGVAQPGRLIAQQWPRRFGDDDLLLACDQLAELGSSFNTMTQNLERLLAVAKEKERMEAEIDRRLALQAAGAMLPFAVIGPAATAIGMTTYMNADAVNKRLEIGATW